MKLFEIRIGDYLEIVQADARGMRTGKVPEAVVNAAKIKLSYLVRHGSYARYAEISRVDPANVSTGSAGSRLLLDSIIYIPSEDHGSTVG